MGRIGLVNEVWPLAELKDRAIALAAERAGVHATRGTPDAREGILAFLEKRRPVFNRPS